MKKTKSFDSAHSSALLWNSSTSTGLSNSLHHSSTTQIGPLHQCEVMPFRPIVLKFDLNVSCCTEAEVDGMDVDERLFCYGLPVPLMAKSGMMLHQDTSNVMRPHLVDELKAETTSREVEALLSGERSSCCIYSSESAGCQPVADPLRSSMVQVSQMEAGSASEMLWDNPLTDTMQGAPGNSISAQAGRVGFQIVKRSETTKRKYKRRGSSRSLKKVRPKKETNLLPSDQASNEKAGSTLSFVPGVLGCTWNDNEVKAFTLALYFFGKDFGAVKRFVEHKAMQDVLHFYYSRFYGTAAHKRWSRASKNRSRYVHGLSLVTGWRQKQLLSRLEPYLAESAKASLFQDFQRFNAEKLPMEQLVFRLKSAAGLENLVRAVGLGSGKHDLTVVPIDPPAARAEVPAGKACSNLTTQEVIGFLTGDHRISKARAQDLFLEAVWPRLLARGWHSQENGKLLYARHRSKLLFLKPGHDFCKGISVEGVDYFSSISEVLSLVAKNRDWLEPPHPGVDITLSVEKKLVSACKQESSVSRDDETQKTWTDSSLRFACGRQDPSWLNLWPQDGTKWDADGASSDYAQLLCPKLLTDHNVSCYRVILSSRRMDWNDEGFLAKNGQAYKVYEMIKVGYKASYSLLVRSLVSPRSLQQLETTFVLPSSGRCPGSGFNRNMLSELLRKECSLKRFPASNILPASVQTENLVEAEVGWTTGSPLVMKLSGAWKWRLSRWISQSCGSTRHCNVLDHEHHRGVGAFEFYRDNCALGCPESASSASCVTSKGETPSDGKSSDLLKLREKIPTFRELSCSPNTCTSQPCILKYASDYEPVKSEAMSLDEFGKVMVELQRGDQTFPAVYHNNFAESRRRRNRSVASLLKRETVVACQSASSQAPVGRISSHLLDQLKVEEFTSGLSESKQYKRRRQSYCVPHQGYDEELEEYEKPMSTFKRHPSHYLQPIAEPLSDYKRSSLEIFSKRCFEELHAEAKVLDKNKKEFGGRLQGTAKKLKCPGSMSNDFKDEDISPASQQLMLEFVYLLRSSFPVFPGQGLQEVQQVVAEKEVCQTKTKGKRSKRNRISREGSCWSSHIDMEDDLLYDDSTSSSGLQSCLRDGSTATKLRRRRRSMGIGSELLDTDLTPPCMRPCTATAYTSQPAKHSVPKDLLHKGRAGSSTKARIGRSIQLLSNTPVPDTRFSSPRKGPSVSKGSQIVTTPEKPSQKGSSVRGNLATTLS